MSPTNPRSEAEKLAEEAKRLADCAAVAAIHTALAVQSGLATKANYDADKRELHAAIDRLRDLIPAQCPDCQGEGIPTFEHDANGNCGAVCPECGSMPAWLRMALAKGEYLIVPAVVGNSRSGE